MSKRDELIKSALTEKLTDGINIYTADDILTVADISGEEMQALHEKIKSEIDGLAKKKRKNLKTRRERT